MRQHVPWLKSGQRESAPPAVNLTRGRTGATNNHPGNQALQAWFAQGATTSSVRAGFESQAEQVASQQAETTGFLRSPPFPQATPTLYPRAAAGTPLPLSVQQHFARRMKADFSAVRIHTDSYANQFADGLHTRAVTSGNHIAFAAQHFSPHSRQGQQLLEHELTHVLQQRQQQGAPLLQRDGGLDELDDYDPEAERLRQCRNSSNWTDGGHWMGSGPEPDCHDATQPGRLECQNASLWSDMGEWRGMGAEPDCSNTDTPTLAFAQSARRAGEEFWARWARNRSSLETIRDNRSTDAQALADMFRSPLEDDGSAEARLSNILMHTEHWLIPGLQTGMAFGDTGFRSEFQDSAIWPSSGNQVGHFLTAVRLGHDPNFLNTWQNHYILDANEDPQIMALRLIVGHEQSEDPGALATLASLLPIPGHWGFEEQYHSASDADIENFRNGNLSAITLGSGRGNSMQDLALSYKGWQLGQLIADGTLTTPDQIADWIEREIGEP